MASIFREDNATFRQIMECSIAYVKYVENGGCISRFSGNMTNQVIDLAMKLKANRDYVDKCLGKEIIQYDEEGNKIEVRPEVSEGTPKANKVRAKREYGQRYNSVPRA